jgi:hypothetical protein
MTPLLFLSLLPISLGVTIDLQKNHVTPLQASKFDSVINKHRSWQIAAVFFYKGNDKATQTMFKQFDEVAAKHAGMFRFAAIDCEKDGNFCKQSNIEKQLPGIIVYPRNPMPAQHVKDFTVDKLSKQLISMLPKEHVKPLNSTSTVEVFLKKDTHMPKVILFNPKLTPEFKALSNEFRNEMNFGHVKDKTVAEKYKVKEFPGLVMQESPTKPLNPFKGKHVYTEYYSWTNLRRETFVKGGGFSDNKPPTETPAVSKPWLEEEVPQIYRESANDVCFKQENLCLIYLKSEGSIGDQEISMLKDIKEKYGNELPNLKLGWMDLSVEESFGELFQVGKLPSAVVFNPHKRLRFAKLGDSQKPDKKGLTDLLDRILGGDGRYKPVKQLPAFSKSGNNASKDTTTEL